MIREEPRYEHRRTRSGRTLPRRPGKGILAADESAPTIEKRFKAIDLPSTEENAGVPDLLFTTPGVSEFISGVILYDETIRQRSADGTPFTKGLERQGLHRGSRSTKGRRR